MVAEMLVRISGFLSRLGPVIRFGWGWGWGGVGAAEQGQLCSAVHQAMGS